MRAREFLIKEASVFKTANNQYVPGYRMSVSGSVEGQKTIAAIKAELPDFNPAEELTVADQNEPANVVATIGKPERSFKLKRANGTVIELQGGKSTIQSSLNGVGPAVVAGQEQKQKMPNKGDTAEGLLGAAMFAKLRKREGGGIGAVTVDDVWEVFDRMSPVTDTDYMVTVKDMGGATDKIWFRLKVKAIVKNALSNQSMRKKLTAWAMSPVNYVNSKEGTEYSEQFYKNGRPDEIGIISDGLSAQTERKSDVFTVVRDPVTGQVAKELLPISLKAGAEQFAQHSGSSFKAMEDMFGLLGLDISEVRPIYNDFMKDGEKIKAASYAYSVAAKIINDSINTDKEEANFVAKLSEALKFWATNNNDNVRVVSFGSKGFYEVLRFDQLLDKMSALDLVAEFIPGENPKLVVKDRQQGVLFHIRTYLQKGDTGTYQRNVIEKGPLLSKIADAVSPEDREKFGSQ